MDNNPPQPKSDQSPLGCIFRVFWLLGGPVTLFFCAIDISLNRRPFPCLADAVFAAALVAAIGLRYADTRFFQGADADGRPATLADWRRYGLRLCLIAGAGLGVAHLLATVL